MSDESLVTRRLCALICLLVVTIFGVGCDVSIDRGSAVDARIAAGAPLTWDPAHAGDSGSANVIAQVFEGLTAFDANSQIQPALADSWQAADDGRQITFHLRPGITYSDASPITAQDVVDSWLRLIDPAQPSPLASLVSDIQGAADYQAGRVGADGVGLQAHADEVVVDLRRPATYFLSVTASPSLAVVPHAMYGRLDGALPADIVVSGAYVPSSPSDTFIRLTGNAHYWAGTPPLDNVELVTDLGGKSGVTAFVSSDVDYTAIGGFDASWIQYDAGLGPQLRRTDDFVISYYGFNTAAPPFDDPTVRLAFAKAVDWDRIVRLGGGVPATSMVPVGVPGRDDIDHRPTYDPVAARDLLATAGFPGGAGFPDFVLSTYGVGFEPTVVTELEHNLGVHSSLEAHTFEDSIGDQGGPAGAGIWTLSWSADYPHAHDFLGLLLETGSTSNDGDWSNAGYDALIEQAAGTLDPDEQAAIYSQAQDILAREAPVVPVAYGESWVLARKGLLGATESGVGLIRIAGLTWQPGTGP